MTYKIGKGNLFTRLINRFRLMTVESVAPLLLPHVQPITDVDFLLRVPTCESTTQNISAAAATVVTCPAGKRYHLKGVAKGATAGSAGVRIFRATNEGIMLIAPTTAAAANVNFSFIMEPGWWLSFDQGAGGDVAVGLDYYLEEEDAY